MTREFCPNASDLMRCSTPRSAFSGSTACSHNTAPKPAATPSNFRMRARVTHGILSCGPGGSVAYLNDRSSRTIVQVKPEPVPTRERILEAARHLFWEKGYAATGMAEILERAEANAGSFYHFFPGKESLLLAVL